MDLTAAATLFAWLDREVWLVTSRWGDRRGGLICTTVTPTTSVAEMPRVALALSRQHFTWELVESSRSFSLHLLSEENIDLVWRFGLESGRGTDKFLGLSPGESPLGNPVLADTVGWLDCRVETSTDTGDRSVYVAEVAEGTVTRFAPPLTHKRLLELAPSARLTQLQRRRHVEAYLDAEAIRAWRDKRRG